MPESEDESYAYEGAEEQQRDDICYNSISFQSRVTLIERVMIEGMTIIKSIEDLEISPSTAKYIVRSFKKKGTIMKKVGKFERQQTEYDKKIQELRQKTKNFINFNPVQQKSRKRKGKKGKKLVKQNKNLEEAQNFQSSNVQNPINPTYQPVITPNQHPQYPQLPIFQTNNNIPYFYPPYVFCIYNNNSFNGGWITNS